MINGSYGVRLLKIRCKSATFGRQLDAVASNWTPGSADSQ